jgi:hypothetical protein
MDRDFPLDFFSAVITDGFSRFHRFRPGNGAARVKKAFNQSSFAGLTMTGDRYIPDVFGTVTHTGAPVVA